MSRESEADPSSIERLAFPDGTLDLNPKDAAAQVFRLYDAIFDRERIRRPGREAGGGHEPNQVVQALATSAEFAARYAKKAMSSRRRSWRR